MGITTSASNKSLDVSSSKKVANIGSKGIFTEAADEVKRYLEDGTTPNLEKSNNEVEYVDVEPDEMEIGFSNTEYSDEDNINVNQLSKIMVEFQNELGKDGKEYYEIFSELIKGKRLGDVLDENGHIKTSSSFSNEDLAKIQELINSKDLNISVDDYLKLFDNSVAECSKEGGASVTLNHISADMLNNVIEEVVSTDNSYDAFVLKNPDNGNYMIVNSCTNAKSADDLLAIAYAMSMQLTGSLDLLDYALEYLLPSLDAEMLDNIKSSDLYMELSTDSKSAAKKIEEIYEKELQDNQELIKKYIDKAKEDGTKVELQGYSLGGGIQLTAYSSLCLENPELENYIESITVFNPYVSFCEENKLNLDDNTKGGNGSDGKLIDYLAKSDKLRIYSNEEDYVSTFNNSLSKLIDKYCFVKSEDLADHASVENITDIYGIVIGGGSNHGFGVIDYDSFEKGNIKDPGTFFAIDESMATTADGMVGFPQIWYAMEDAFGGDEFKYRIDYKRIIENTLKLENIREMVSNNGEAAVAFFDYVLSYIEDNVGNYNYEDFSDAIAEACWLAIEGGIDETFEYSGGNLPDWIPDSISSGIDSIISNTTDGLGNGLTGLINLLGDKEKFKDGIKAFLKKDENVKILMSALSASLNGDNEKAKKYYNLLLDSLELAISDSNSEIWTEYSMEFAGVQIPSTPGLIGYSVNEFLKQQFIDKLRGVVDEL